jgi:8-oxo-dGTP diphosphatase
MTISHDSETPAFGLQVFTACAFIHHNFNGQQKVFLPRRADSKKFLPGKYELPGGHVDFGETMVDGLLREIREELNQDILVGDPFAVFTYTNQIKGSHSIEVVYFACFKDGTPDITLNPEDHSTAGWFSEAEATSLNDSEDDEVQVIRKGFAILSGQAPKIS